MRWIAPELATLTKKYFSDKDWIYEEKFDGVRCIAVKKNGKVTLYSRNKKPLSGAFPELVQALEKKKSADFVVDGEIVAFEGRVTSFSKLQGRLGKRKYEGGGPKVYLYVFDLLRFKDRDYRKLPLIERKAALKKLFPFGGSIRYTRHIKEKGEALLKKACKKGLEGIIAKKASAKYHSRRTRDWLKFKCSAGQELVIGGYTEPQGSRTGFGALLVGYYKNGKFCYAGKVGTGYDTKMLKTLGARLQRIERQSCPFTTKPKERKAHFVRPQIVCEVGFTEWTRDGKLRHPRFEGIRTDKKAKQVRREK